MNISLHSFDLPESFIPHSTVAIDTEAMGLQHHRDRLCLVQLSNGDGTCHLVHFPVADFSQSPRLVHLLTDATITKIFHYARFDVAILQHSFSIMMAGVYCTKIASRLARTYTNKHGLKDLCKDLLGVELSKNEQTSDWGAAELTPDQKRYAASDVLYLHQLKNSLDALLKREQRDSLCKACCDFLPYRATLDLMVNDTFDIFSYKVD
jgi:ribonuclease D